MRFNYFLTNTFIMYFVLILGVDTPHLWANTWIITISILSGAILGYFQSILFKRNGIIEKVTKKTVQLCEGEKKK